MRYLSSHIMILFKSWLTVRQGWSANFGFSSQGRIQGGFEGFVRWWVILHHHATCGQTSKLFFFPASAPSCNLQFCPRLLFPQPLSRQQADWCQPGVGPSGCTSCSRGLSAVNQRIQNYSPVVPRLRIAWKTWSLLGEGVPWFSNF